MQRRTFLTSLGGLCFGLGLDKLPIITDISFQRDISTGFPSIDKILGPILPGELILVAGRECMGKTALVLNIINNISVKENIPTLLFSLDLPSMWSEIRMQCTLAKVSIHEYRYGQLNDEEIARLDAASEKMQTAPFMVLDFVRTLDEIETVVKSIKEGIGIRAAFIDPANLLVSPNQDILNILTQLKDISSKHNIPIVAVLDLSDYKYYNRPEILICDKALIVNQPWIDNWDFDRQELAEITVLNQRRKISKTIPIKFIGQYHLFEDLPKGNFV